MTKVLSTLLMGALTVILGFFALAIYNDFCVWYDQCWTNGVITGMTKSSRELKSESDSTIQKTYANRMYKIRFRNIERKYQIVESINFQVGDSIRILYSPHCPKNFKIKIPSIVWVGTWALVFILFAPLILYYAFVFVAGQLRE